MERNDNDYDSSEDEDYVPPDDAEVDEDKDDLQYDDVEENLSAKAEVKDQETHKETKKIDTDNEKRLEMLWADFIGTTDSASTTSTSTAKEETDNGSRKRNQISTEKDLERSTPKSGAKRSGGLANAALVLSKKKKMSVLDKSSHDWKQFVEKEGIEDDLKSHIRSKESFLDKQDFLCKADYSQFETEKALREVERAKK